MSDKLFLVWKLIWWIPLFIARILITVLMGIFNLSIETAIEYWKHIE